MLNKHSFHVSYISLSCQCKTKEATSGTKHFSADSFHFGRVENCVHFCPNYSFKSFSLVEFWYMMKPETAPHDVITCFDVLEIEMAFDTIQCGTNFYVSLHASSLPSYSCQDIINNQKMQKSLFLTVKQTSP